MSYKGIIKLVDAKSGDDWMAAEYATIPDLIKVFKNWEKLYIVQSGEKFIHVVPYQRMIKVETRENKKPKYLPPPKPLPTKQECIAYIKEHRQRIQIYQIAKNLDIPLATAKRYLKEVNQERLSKIFVKHEPVLIADPPKEDIIRAKPQYSNRRLYDNL